MQNCLIIHNYFSIYIIFKTKVRFLNSIASFLIVLYIRKFKHTHLKKLSLVFYLLGMFLLAQTPEGKWQDYFSYFHIKDVIEKPNHLICATENGLFTYDKSSGELEKISKVHGLHGVKISTVGYNKEYDYLFVAYENGALDILTPEGIEYFVDIPIDTDFQGDKAVNHIHSVGEKAVLSMDFGVVIFDLPNLEFDETTYFRNGSDFFVVNESVILNNEIIALSQNGIYTHEIGDLIPNFNAWEHYFSGQNYTQAELFSGKAIVGNSQQLYSTEDGVTFNSISVNGTYIDINTDYNESTLSVIYPHSVQTYNSNLSPESAYAFSEAIKTGISASNGVFGGTKELGLLPYNSEIGIAPDGPFSNISYKLTLFEDHIYVAPGGRRNYYFPSGIDLGYYHFDGTEWINVPKESLSDLGFNQIAINPLHTTEAYLASYGGQGITVTDQDIETTVWTQGNSSIHGLVVSGEWHARICSHVFDPEGNLYAVEANSNGNLHGNNLNIKTPSNQWVNIALPLPSESTAMVLLDSKGWLWIGVQRTGGTLLAYNTNDTPIQVSDDISYKFTSAEDQGNLPSDEMITCIAEDKNGTIWIGTSQGIRIKRNPHSALEEGDYSTDLIVVEQAGLPEEFLKDVLILDIAVDEGNNKWISTSGGVFFVNSTGTETKEIFNYDNSPLPSNFIKDIEIDNATGKVYFASADGIVSYQGDYITVGDEFGDIIVYPNPVRPNFNGNIIIKGLAQNAKVKITDINGNLVQQGIAKGGVFEWDQNNLQGKRVASGVYLALMLNDNNLISATAKFAIVR